MWFFSNSLFPANWRVFCVAAAMLFAASFSVYAEEPTDLGEIEVKDKSDQTHTPSLDSSATATVIIPKESKDLNITVPELLEQSAGVNVKRYGGLDDFSAISLQGSSAAQVQIYLDEIPLATSQGEMTDLSIIPIETIERIEIYRGGSPAMVPDSTAGGVIIIRTKNRSKKTETTISNTGGSFTTYKGIATRAESFKNFSYIGSYERSQSDGNFLYINNKGTTFNTADDELAQRQNNDFASNSLYLKPMFKFGENTNFSISNIFFNKDQGIPGLGNRQSLNARLTTWRDMVSAIVDWKFPSVRGLFCHADVFFDYLKDEFKDPDNNIGLGIQNNEDDTYRFGENLRASYDLGKHQQLKFFVAHRSEYFVPTNYAATPPRGPHSHRLIVNAGAEDEISLFEERLSLKPSLRLSNLFNHLSNQDPSVAVASQVLNSRSDHQLSAKMGVSIRMIDEFYFKGNFYRGFRNPTFSELFGDRGTVVGNPTLKPEEAINFDLGLAYHYHKEDRVIGFDLESTYFRHDISSLIQFLQTSQFTVKAQNMNKALIQGAEFSAKINWSDKITGYANYTYQSAKDTSGLPATNGKYLPGRPKHDLAAGTGWTQVWENWFSTRLSAELNYMSSNYLDTQNLLSVQNRALISASVATIFVKGITLSFAVKNILNERISDLVGYPLPGRSYWGTLELKI